MPGRRAAHSTVIPVDTKTAAGLAGCAPATLRNWSREYPDFPSPIHASAARRAWDLIELTSWLARNRGLEGAAGALLEVAGGTSFVLEDDQLPLLVHEAVLECGEYPSGISSAAHAAPSVEEFRASLHAACAAVMSKSEVARWDMLYRSFTEELVDVIHEVVSRVRSIGDQDFMDALMSHCEPSERVRHSPPALQEIAVALARPEGKILDPCAGTGALLLHPVVLARANSLNASETDPWARGTLAMRIYRTGRPAVIHHVDATVTDPFPGQRFDRIYIDVPWKHDFDLLGRPIRRRLHEYRYLEYAASHLTEDGVAVVFTSDEPAVYEPGDALSRSRLLASGQIAAHIQLEGVSPISRSTCAWVIKGPDRVTDTIVFADASALSPRLWRTDPRRAAAVVLDAVEEAQRSGSSGASAVVAYAGRVGR